MADETGARVLIVDDHPLFRDALKAALWRASPTARVDAVGSLDAARQALANGHTPDLVLLDLNLSDATGFDGLIRLQTGHGDVPIVVVSATDTPEAFARAASLGARGYLPKSLDLDALAAALTCVLEGERWFPDLPEDLEGGEDDPARRVASLTPAQRRVLNGLADGLLNKQIAYEMGISEATVKAHMTAIFRKLGVNNRTQALLVLQTAGAAGDHSAA